MNTIKTKEWENYRVELRTYCPTTSRVFVAIILWQYGTFGLEYSDYNII